MLFVFSQTFLFCFLPKLYDCLKKTLSFKSLAFQHYKADLFVNKPCYLQSLKLLDCVHVEIAQVKEYFCLAQLNIKERNCCCLYLLSIVNRHVMFPG